MRPFGLFAGLALVAAGLAGAGAIGVVHAQETGAASGTVYWLGTATKHTNITFTSEADIENIYGITNVSSGNVRVDWEKKKGSAAVTVPVASLKTGIDLRDEHLRSDKWLDAEKYPDITFTAESFDLVQKNAEKGLWETKVAGKLTIHGVTRDLETTARVVRHSPELSKKIGNGEWVRIVAAFDVTIADFGVVVPDGPVQGKVSPTWSIKFDCYATSVAPEPAKK